MNKQPVFYLSNTDRRSEFLIETKIWEKQNSYYVEKKALNEEAKKHIKNMVHTYTELLKIKKLTSGTGIVKPKKSDSGSLLFDFIEGISVERALLNKVLLEDHDGSFGIIDKLFSLVDSLPSTTANPSANPAYNEVLGGAFNQKQDCVKLGLIDLNLDNFILDKQGNWHFYDYEWSFNFPISKRMLKIRSLWYFVYRHREVLKFHAQHIESVRLYGKVYVPKFLFEHYKKLFESLDDLILAERNFQAYVTGKTGSGMAAFYGESSTPEEGTKPLLGMDAFIYSALATERKQRQKTEAQLNLILSSKSYRLAKKLSNGKNRLSKNK